MTVATGEPVGGTANRRQYVRDLMQTLWPEPCRVIRGWRATSSPGNDVRRFVVVPNDRRPTLVVPRRPLRAAANGLLHYKTSADGQTRLKLRAVAAAARVGAFDLLPNRFTIE